MAKMRGIKPETWTDERFVELSPLARLLFVGMWNFACDNGHLDDSPRQLKMRILPADGCDPEPLVEETVNTGLVERRDGFLKVTNLTEHQRIDLRYLSLCDHCDNDVHSTFTHRDKTGARRAHGGRTAGPRAEGEGEGEKKESAPVRPDVLSICQHLADRIEANGSKRPNITNRWHTSARLLIDNDKRDTDEVHRVIDWCQDSEFWKSNILSMPKLRDKYDTLRLQSGAGAKDANPWAHLPTPEDLVKQRGF